jgi:hypothetical protein
MKVGNQRNLRGHSPCVFEGRRPNEEDKRRKRIVAKLASWTFNPGVHKEVKCGKWVPAFIA